MKHLLMLFFFLKATLHNSQRASCLRGRRVWTFTQWKSPDIPPTIRDLILRAQIAEKEFGVEDIPIFALFIRTFQRTLYSSIHSEEKESQAFFLQANNS